jgi:hypothetical protein
MEIKIGKFIITSDDRQYVLSEEKISKSGKSEGNTYTDDIGYYCKLVDVLNALLELKLRRSDATTLGEFKNDYMSFREELKNYLT